MCGRMKRLLGDLTFKNTMRRKGGFMGRMSKRKGDRIEREIVNLLKEAGIHAERVPLPGAVGGSFSGDIVMDRSASGRSEGQGLEVVSRR